MLTYPVIMGSLLLLVCFSLPTLAQDKTPAQQDATANRTVQADVIWDGRKIVPFRTLDSPKMVKASEADFLGDDEYILGVVVNGESRAYPTRFAWWHHAINDTTSSGMPIAITYCSVCNTGICYDRTIEGKPIFLDFYGLYNGVVTLCDRAYESVMLQAEGRFVTGPLKDKSLKAYPLLDTTWGKWKKSHPDTLLMSPQNAFEQVYRPKGKAEPRGYERFPMPFFQQTLTRTDDRLPRFEKVLGVTLVGGGKTLYRAYPLKSVQEGGTTINDTMGTTSLVVFLESDTQTATAFSRVFDGKTLTFEARKEGETLAFFDKETGSRWNVEGKAEAGTLMGKTLTPVLNHLSQWYGWVAYFPETEIYGKTDPPHTVTLIPPTENKGSKTSVTDEKNKEQ